MQKSVAKLFKVVPIEGSFYYTNSIVDKNTYTIKPEDVSFYNDAMKVIEKIEQDNFGIDKLFKLYPKPGKSNIFATHPDALKKHINDREKEMREQQQQSESTSEPTQQPPLKRQRVTPTLPQDCYDKIVQKIIGYTLMADTFLQQDLLPETQTEEWKELMVELSGVLFSLALVSKQFFANVGRVLETLNWTRRFPNKYIKGQINYDRPFCMFKKVPSSIRYDALIRTTPYRLVDQVFNGVTSLTIVGDTLDWSYIDGVDKAEELKNDNYYDIAKPNFVTYPPIGSMPNLTKLVVVGRAFTYRHKQQGETGGLYLLKYLIANTGCKLEQFECIEQLCLDYQPEFDISLFECLFDKHKSTIKLVKLKRTTKKNRNYLTALEMLVEKLKSYQSKIKFKLEFYDSVSNNATKDSEDAYKVVKEFEDLELLQKDDEDDDSDGGNDVFDDDSYDDM
ncbi:hypothetical protein PPL_03428 [Heterostelium album PN500]|uniref:Uncharacterized protein n=1 Tax=Heterostelium pallidum (strain ATCC 26659 / Pp 5 / PN500) TaxID=670386 RepID=D3B4V2_HETP5|nr:hypothetical protein PPL_03428 [Heterostelium album PN500]EFA84350.1 hypothetical protein PPL_03428 [Heterostelium album PN500]|eukprot:XP_020436465.1 hypothetical protein PPL_03428 [Heterostelium album PN500]